MYKDLKIHNFRQFKKLHLNNLSRVNLIGGMNNTGKTSLLEAIFLMLGPNNPELILKIDSFRGIGGFTIQKDDFSRSVWGWLFYDKLTAEEINITTTDYQNIKKELVVKLVDPERQHIVTSSIQEGDVNGSLTTSVTDSEIQLIYKVDDSHGKDEIVSRLFIEVDSLQIVRGKMQPLPRGLFLPARTRTTDDIERFSELDASNRQDSIVDALRLLEPRLKRLTISYQGGKPFISGDIGLKELLPISLMGEGIGRLFSVVVAIANATGGTVLIDEIENGIHYSVLSKIWQAIAKIAQQSDTQVFATTHSLECIQAAHTAFLNAEEYDFRYYRLEHNPKTDDIEVLSYDQETIETSIEMNFEMR